jgi:uncharacterized membrane protein (UPF0127 family)
MDQKRFRVLLVLGALIVLGAWYVFQRSDIGAQFTGKNACRNFAEARLTLDNRTIRVALADTYDERVQGLSGCAKIPANSGMYFIFPKAERTAFWMKDMTVPIDIIWVAQGKVLGIDKNVPIPSPGQDVKTLPTYSSPRAVDGVLELPAGKADEYGLKPGSTVELAQEVESA